MTYFYECRSCGHTLEGEQKITDVAWVECPKCERPALQRLITNGTFILKGEGWEKKGGY